MRYPSISRLFFPGFILLLLSGFSIQSLQAQSDRDLKKLVTRMTGDFNSKDQSLRDSDYYDIRLHIRQIWTNQSTGVYWLYVEQATASAEEKPYRQRIYQVEREGESGFKSSVYTLPDPEKWVGAYKNPALFDQLKPADLSLREGCAVYLTIQKEDGAFVGATRGEGCESTLRGAKYASASVLITDEMLISWDQGFDAQGKQVWGATKGGYEFVKQ
ncbi:MAG: chromophore lyase CpcT/CpeT [Lewinellaceae bacterium]|nr:chromophore lyase CpcT/CpeT [Lewinellaceae bacterium]